MKRVGRFLAEHNTWIFVALFVAMFFVYRFLEYYPYGPIGFHTGRQADCLSFAKVYYNDGRGLLDPGVMNLDNSGTGNAVSEFPILYYSYAKLWTLFGQHEWIARLINTLIVFLGLLSLHKLLKKLVRDPVTPVVIPLLYFTSPILVYYTNNFIADAPAVGLMLCGWYQLYRFYENKKTSTLIGGQLLFLFAGLLKVTALYTWVALLGVFAFDVIRLLLKRPTIFHSHLKYFLSCVGVVLGIFLWYRWSINYNEENWNGMFLQGILPIWDMNHEQIMMMKDRLWDWMMIRVFSPKALALLLAFFVFMIVSWRKSGAFTLEFIVLCTLGVFAHFMLFFAVFDVHDYYLVNHTAWIAVILVCFAVFLERNYPNVSRSVAVRVIWCALLFFTAKDTVVRQDIHIQDDMWNSFPDLYTLEPALREAGVTKDDHIIVLPDNTLNVALYYCGTKGENDFGFSITDSAMMVGEIERINAKYFVALDENVVAERHLEPMLGDVVLTHGKITVYKLK